MGAGDVASNSGQAGALPSGSASGRLARLQGLVLAAVAAGGLVAARLLTPAASGVGTHQELGLPPCSFHAVLHLPCPMCGFTTSLAHMARGHLVLAFRSHALGPPAFALLALLVPIGGWLTVANRPFPRLKAWLPWAVLGLVGVAWVIRLASHAFGFTLWAR